MPDRKPSALFVEQFYYPDGSGGTELPRDLSTHLVDRGYEVEVICGSEQYVPVDGSPGADPALQGVRIRRIPRLLGGDIHRFKILRQAWFCAALLPLLFFSVARACSSHRLTRRLPCRWSRRGHAPASTICSSRWMFTGSARGSRCHSSAWSCVTVTRFCVQARIPRCTSGRRTRTSHARTFDRQGCCARQGRRDFELVDGRRGVVRGSRNTLRTQWGLEGKFVLVYSGNLGLATSSRPFSRDSLAPSNRCRQRDSLSSVVAADSRKCSD